jgi:hypothetical protein
LLTREEGMAVGADINFDKSHRGTSRKLVSASASYRRCFVFWMNSCLHEGRFIPLINLDANLFLSGLPLNNSVILLDNFAKFGRG